MDDEERKLSTGVYDAVAGLPSVICDLVGMYAMTTHDWQIDSTDPFLVRSSRSEIEIRSDGWSMRKYSTTTSCEDCADFDVELEVCKEGLPIAAGITASDPTAEIQPATIYKLMAGAADWMIAVGSEGTNLVLYVMHAGSPVSRIQIRPAVQSNRLRIWFSVDGASATVQATVNGRIVGGDIGFENRRINAPLAAIRPSVAAFGDGTTIIRSGRSADFPADGATFVLVAFEN